MNSFADGLSAIVRGGQLGFADMATSKKRGGVHAQSGVRSTIRLRGQRFPGVPSIRSATFASPADAQQWALQHAADVQRHLSLRRAEAERHTLAEAIDRYIESVLPALRSQPVVGAQLAWWRKHLGALRLSNLTPAEIIRQRDALLGEPGNRRRRVANATLNRYVAALSVVLYKACREWEWLGQPPTAHVARLEEPRGRTRCLNEEERQALLQACRGSRNSHLHTIVVLALSTGASKRELLALRWADVDLARKRLVLRVGKHGGQREVPISAAAQAILESAASDDSDALLFPSPRLPDQPIALQCAWETAVSKAGLKDFRFHDLRHAAASDLAMGGTTGDVEAHVGHKSLASVARHQPLTAARTGAVEDCLEALPLAPQTPAIPRPRSRPERVANPFAPRKASTCMLARAGSCNVQVGLGGVDMGAVPGSDICAPDAGAYGYPNSAAFVPDTLYDFFWWSTQQLPTFQPPETPFGRIER